MGTGVLYGRKFDEYLTQFFAGAHVHFSGPSVRRVYSLLAPRGSRVIADPQAYYIVLY